MPFKDSEQQREYQKRWIAKHREDWLNENGPCIQCGSEENLEIDHIDPNDKKVHVGRIWSYKKETRDRELAKCQVLCSVCHKKKTGRESCGEDRHASKFTEQQIRTIRSEYRKNVRGFGAKSLAKKYGTTLSTMQYILLYKTWKHA